MAKKIWNNPIDKSVDWGGDPVKTEGLPVSGEQVQRFIKETFDKKAGVFYYDAANNRYLVFADTEERDNYLADPTQTQLIIGTFDAPFNYSAEIMLTSPAYNAVFVNSVGNYIEFSFDIKNKQGASTGENVNVTYTFMRNATKKTVSEIRKHGEAVRFNIDSYLGEGTNTIIVGITGQTTLAATTVAITYQVVNLTLSDSMDIAKPYDLSTGAKTLEIPFEVSGYGTKIVEWYLDGVEVPYDKIADEIVDVAARRTKYITLSNLQQGRHSIQFRAYTLVNGEKFYTDTLYRDFLVYTGTGKDLIIGVAVTIPHAYGVLGANDPVAIYDMVQYTPYTLRFATYSPSNASSSNVTVKLDKEIKGTVSSANNTENAFSLMSSTAGNKTLQLTCNDMTYSLPVVVSPTSMNLSEITESLVLDFNALGKSYNSSDREEWSYGPYTGTLSGFNWNVTSGWVDGRLEMNAGSSFGIDYAPLANDATKNGKTIEIEWSTKNVSNDDAVICDLRGENGVGILITATKVIMKSADGVVVETEYKSEENVRVGFVINQSSGSTNQRLSFIYANGILSRGEKWSTNDNYISDKQILFTATEEAEISLKAIRIYDAALTSDQMLNNYILYRDSVDEMMEVYDRNDVYEDGTSTFSPSKMMNRLPVMIVTGDIPILENTSDKDTQIVVDVEYTNVQDPSKSFRMEGAAMRPQGTSSMGYPKKNFRIYTQKVDGTVLYDANGNVVPSKLYSFTDKAQPVDCWCLKADYAESSGTHNTGIARLWNNALMNVQIDGEYVCRTGAQKAALEAGYEYDVRTTIDGFPILLFYRPTKNDDVIFIGKYNFNNDKSTESVFGFTGIPNFNNSRMQCWEVLNNGNPLSLFTTVDGFDTGWSEAFESRYPDTKTPNTGDLKAFCRWMVNVSQEDFATQKWQHLNIYMMAAYWVYLMRHAAADQFVKNAMFTSEDGQHFYYILYDNDTINGLINTGRLRISPTDDRQTVDATGSYVFAGHDSRLWNMLEADEEFKAIVSEIDNALYSAGISYTNTIKIFDEEQADKWVEKVYNQDAQYKYIGPYVEKGVDNLYMLQGKRDLHRRWWLAKRFSIYDAKYVSGTYKSQAVELKCLNGTEAGQKFTVTAGAPLDYGFGINNVPREYGVTLNTGESHTFTTGEVVNVGDPIRIYGAPNIAELDLSAMASRLAVVTVDNVYDESLGTKLTKLVLGKSGVSNLEVTEISGLKQAVALEHLDIRGFKQLTSINLSEQTKLKTLIATSSGATSFTFAKGAPIQNLALPSGLRSLELSQLPYLAASGITFENLAALESVNITSCPNVTNDFSFVYNWYTHKTVADARTSLVLDNVDWKNVDAEHLLEIANIGTLSLKGKVYLNSINYEQMAQLMGIFGETAFDSDAEFFIDGPAAAFVLGKTELLEGTSESYKVITFGGKAQSIQFTLYNGSNSYTTVSQDGLLTVKEGFGQGSFTMRVIVTTATETFYTDVAINVTKRIYPTASNLTIEGSSSIENDYHEYALSYPDSVNGEFDTVWALTANEIGYVDIESSDDFGCTLKRLQDTYLPIYLTLTATLTKKANGAAVATVSKEIVYVNEDVAETDAGIIAALYGAGLCSSDKFITKEEAARITASDLQPGTTKYHSIFFNHRTKIKSFNGFQYFTSVTEVPLSCFSDTYLESVVLHNGVTSIGASAFSSCGNLKSINIPRSLISIGDLGFKNTLLESVDLPEGFMSLGSNVFDECYQLKSFKIPSTLTTIRGTFAKCQKLQFYVADSNPNYKSIDGVLFDKDGTKLLYYRKSDVVQNYIIPEDVTMVGDGAFKDCSELLSVKHDGKSLYLGADAFYECTQLKQVDAVVDCPNTSPFYRCNKLESITIAASVTQFGYYTLYGCRSLKTIKCLGEIAPNTINAYACFGNSSMTYTGENTSGTGENYLYVPLRATGYDKDKWLYPLQSERCGFSIYGQLTISSNRTFAEFSVTYNTTGGTMKSVTLGVGTYYLSDVQYGTSMTIVPITTGVGDWDWSSKTFVYGRDNNAVENNAYVFPTNATIEGDINPVKNNTYTWSTTIHDVDGAFTAEWSLSGEITSQVEIASQDNTKCVMKIVGVPTEFYYGTLTLTLRKTDGTLLATATKSLAAVIEDVIVTSKSNELLQKVLYVNGLVANETYSLKSEIEKITTGQLFTGRSGEGNIFVIYGNSHANGYLKNFTEFQYFTGVDRLLDYAIGNMEVVLPNTITSIGRQGLSGISNKSLIIPASVTSFAESAVIINNNLKTITSYAKATSIPRKCFADNYLLESITIPESVTSIGNMAFGECARLREIICKPKTAPVCDSTAFNYSGTSATSTRYLHVPTGATGYEEGVWANIGFIIYGRLRIISNKETAKFNVSYTTTDGTIRTINVGVGSTYLNDIKYDTQMTITPVAISGYTWSEASKTFVYNDSTQGHAFNAYIYPTAMTIEGTGSVVGGKSATYTAALTPSNFDVPVTYTWSVSGSSNVSITPNGSTCVVNTNAPENNESFTIKCVVKSNDNKVSFEKTMNVALMTRENYITAVYNVTDISSNTSLLYEQYALSNVTFMEIDGVQVTPTLSYKFSTVGEHTVRYTLSDLTSTFYGVTALVSVDFSLTNGKMYTSFEDVFVSCSNLVSVEFGDEKFSNISTLQQAFYGCAKLQSVDLSAFNGAPVTTMNRMCRDCSALSSLVLPTLNVSNVNCGYFLYGSSLVEVDLSPLAGVKGNITFDNSFRRCSNLQSLDFTPLANTPNFYSNTFTGCIKLSTIILPFMTAPATDSYTFGSTTSTNTGNTYTGYSTKGRNVLYVPNGATGYDTGVWLEPLQSSSKCGFTISYTL